MRLAAVLPLSGDLAPFGRSARRGIELGIAEVNRDRPAGRRLEAVFLDDQSQPREAERQAARALNNEQAEALLGGIGGVSAMALRNVAELRRVPLLIVAGGHDGLTDGSRFACRVGAGDAALVNAIARYAVEDLELSRFYLLADAGGEWASLQADRFGDQANRRGGHVLALDSLDAKTDLFKLSRKVAIAEPDGVFAALSHERLILVADALRKAGVTAPILTTCNEAAGGLPAIPASAALRPAYLAVPFLPDDPADAVQRFAADMARAFPGAPTDAISASGHDAVLLLAEAVRARTARGGTLRDRLTETLNLPAVLGPIAVRDGRAERPVVIARLAVADPDSREANKLLFVQRVDPWKAARPAAGPATAPDKTPSR